ncbi:MAG: hypothetical protein HPM95_11865 [Alphaproteobacteria bacterium]|nr:hypothetical protein [Alphaproteobacteria bacterium]
MFALKWHRLLVRAGWWCRLAGQGDIVDARVRRRDDSGAQRHSTNHGRLLCCPTSSSDVALPRTARTMVARCSRHRIHYVEIPFSLYDGDLMIGLHWGSLVIE